jgi:hypothetical protein
MKVSKWLVILCLCFAFAACKRNQCFTYFPVEKCEEIYECEKRNIYRHQLWAGSSQFNAQRSTDAQRNYENCVMRREGISRDNN